MGGDDPSAAAFPDGETNDRLFRFSPLGFHRCRQKNVEERMKAMPKLIEEYREKFRAWRRCDGMSPIDKTFMTPGQLRKKQKAQQN